MNDTWEAGKVLLLGATGATGQRAVRELLRRDCRVVALVRDPKRLPPDLVGHPGLGVVKGEIGNIPDAELAELTADCSAIISCLGHNLSMRGILGPPWFLVRDAVRLCYRSVQLNNPPHPVKFILMNTTGFRGPGEKVSRRHIMVLTLIRWLVPPQRDNEKAAEFLIKEIGPRDKAIRWVVVRPDTLVNLGDPPSYSVVPAPRRDPIFDPGKTSRENVARFMAELVCRDEVWQKWEGQLPVIYDEELAAE